MVLFIYRIQNVQLMHETLIRGCHVFACHARPSLMPSHATPHHASYLDPGLDSNQQPLNLEANAQPTEPQDLLSDFHIYANMK